MNRREIITPPSGVAARRVPWDRIGFIAFNVLGAWMLWNGWVPLFRQSQLAGILVLPEWLCAFAMAVGFLLRKPLVASYSSFLAKACSYIVTFSLPIYFALMGRQLVMCATGPLRIIGITIAMLAGIFSLSGIWALRSAFSIEPQARTLITSGPYEYARHPLYTAYLLRHASMLVLYLNFQLTVVILIWCGLLLYRIHCEEKVLTEAFPEYRNLKTRVWMFSPKLF